MSLRGFGNQAVTGSPQPLFGTSLSAAVTPSPDPFTGRLDPGSMPSSCLLPLNAPSNLFRVGDHIAVGTSPSFLQSNTAIHPDGGTVQQVSASNILVMGLQRKHSASEWVVLALPCAQINIQANANSIYLGEDPSVGPNSPTLIETAGPSGQITIGVPAFANLIETQKLWILGTGADSYLPYLLTV